MIFLLLFSFLCLAPNLDFPYHKKYFFHNQKQHGLRAKTQGQNPSGQAIPAGLNPHSFHPPMKIVLLNPPSINSQYINRDLMGGLGVNAIVKEKFSEKVMSFLKAQSIRLPVMSLVYSATILNRCYEISVIDAANLSLSVEGNQKKDRIIKS